MARDLRGTVICRRLPQTVPDIRSGIKIFLCWRGRNGRESRIKFQVLLSQSPRSFVTDRRRRHVECSHLICNNRRRSPTACSWPSPIVTDHMETRLKPLRFEFTTSGTLLSLVFICRGNPRRSAIFVPDIPDLWKHKDICETVSIFPIYPRPSQTIAGHSQFRVFRSDSRETTKLPIV